MLLSNGMKEQFVKPTEYTRKLTIDGHTDSYQVYKIRLDSLYYNDQNDRIATWISKYKTENNIDRIDTNDENYNDIIEQFIYESNPKAIDKTQNNIKLVGQREAGVVLKDGRVIDGNRRFTCLRRIEKETHEPHYFEAVILDRDIDTNEKAVKLLELTIQHGEEGKVDYNPIDKLVGIYNDLMKHKLITIDEYSKAVNESRSRIEKKMEQAQLMVDFLEFINAEEQFFIARDLELDGPLGEMPSILNKAKSDEDREAIKLIIFSNIIMKPHGDITRYVRKMKKIVESKHNDEFIEEQLPFVESIIGKLSEPKNMDSQFLNNNLRTDNDMKDSMKSSVDKFEIKVKSDSSKAKPLNDLKQCNILIDNIDINIIKRLSEDEQDEFINVLDNCFSILSGLKSELKGD